MRRTPSRSLGTALIALFFVSGATSLVYETLWARQLHLVFGTSQLAISTILAAFMGGLAAGGFAAARWAGRVRSPIAAYAWLEAFIGAYALVFPALQTRVQSVFLTVESGDLGQTPRAALQLLLAGLLLLPPTLCMGATLPLLARMATASAAVTGSTVGRLYGVNTLGAVTGTALAGFVLLPFLGLSTTTRWTAAANLVLALAAAVTARAWGPPPSAASSKATAGARRPTRVPILLLVMAAATGFTGLLYEVAWFRLMSLLLGGSAYAFSIMLLAFLLGIGLGGLIGGWSIARRAGGGSSALLRDLAAIEIGIGVLSWGAMFLYGKLPYLWVHLFGLVEDSWPLIWGSQLAIALAIMTPPAVLMGVSFPYLAHLADPRTEQTDRAVGLVYGANTLGSIGGAVGGALFVLPVLHVRGAILVGASLNVAIALIAAIGSMSPSPRRWRRAAGVAAVAIAAIALIWWQPPPWDPMVMSSGVYQYVRAIRRANEEGRGLYVVDPEDELLFYDEGLTSVVTVAQDGLDGNIWLANNGKIDASSQGDLKTQVLLGQLGFAFRPDAREVMVVGLASGISAGSVTLRSSPRAIDIVEIEPVIVEASRKFNEFNHRPLDDPRVRLVLDDARGHLMRTPDGHYDLAISEPSNPWISGVANLFTREFFELGKSKLSPSGVWVQWLHCYEMSADDLRSLLATFAAVYPEVQVFRIDASDLAVLGSRASLRLSAETIRSSLAKSAMAAIELRDIGIGEPEDLLAHYLFGRDRLTQFAGSVELNTDDNMRIEYSAPLHLYDDTAASNDRLLLEHAELPALAVDGVLGLFALANGYTNIGLEDRAEAAMAAAHQLAVTQAQGAP